MNGVYPGRGAKAYAPLRGPSQCVKRLCNTCTASSQCAKQPCNTCAAPSQCAKRPCNTCTASSQCAKGSCNTCTASSQCAKRPRTTCTASSQCVKRPCNTCTALSQCAPLPRGQSFIPAGCLGGECNSPLHGYPAKLRCPRRGRPYHGDNHSSLRNVWGRMLLHPYMYPANFAAPAGAAPTRVQSSGPGYPANFAGVRRRPPPPPNY